VFLDECKSLVLLSMVIAAMLAVILDKMEEGGHWFDPSRE
jgi:hypothetical protein